MKRVIKLVSVILVMLCLTFAVSASNGNDLIISYPENNITVEFDASTTLSSTKRQVVADAIVLDTPIIQSRAWCWLTGHDKTSDTVGVTYHKQMVLDPRCLLEVYIITTCTKCDYYEEELYSSGYISCCPVD